MLLEPGGLGACAPPLFWKMAFVAHENNAARKIFKACPPETISFLRYCYLLKGTVNKNQTDDQENFMNFVLVTIVFAIYLVIFSTKLASDV